MGISKEHKNATPERATATAKAFLRSIVYASKTQGSMSGGNTLRSSEAPVRSTGLGSTPIAVFGRVAAYRILSLALVPVEQTFYSSTSAH